MKKTMSVNATAFYIYIHATGRKPHTRVHALSLLIACKQHAHTPASSVSKDPPRRSTPRPARPPIAARRGRALPAVRGGGVACAGASGGCFVNSCGPWLSQRGTCGRWFWGCVCADGVSTLVEGCSMPSKTRVRVARRRARAVWLVLIAVVVGAVMLHTVWHRRDTGAWGRRMNELVVTVRDDAGKARRVVVVTASNYAFREYVLNFNCTLSRHAPNVRPLVVALDARVAAWLRETGFASVGMDTDAEVNEVKFGSAGFNLLSKMKLAAVSRLLQYDVDVIFSDADVVWCSDVVAALVKEAYSRDKDGGVVDMVMQTAWPRSLLNSGFYYVKANARTRRLFHTFLAYPGAGENDQVIVNKVLCRAHGGGRTLFPEHTRRHPAAPSREMPYGCEWNGARVRVLEGSQWPTGGEIMQHGIKIFHMNRRDIVNMCESGRTKVVHNNCVMAEKKKARMIVKGLWWVADDGSCAASARQATREARRRCGGAKCGKEGDLRRYPHLVV